MIKCFIIILSFFVFSLPVFPMVISGGVDMTDYKVRDNVFQSPIIQPDYNLLNSHIFDINNSQNKMNLLKGYTNLKDRTLAYFSDGTYGVIYCDNPMYVWYYENNGVLIYFDIKSSLDLPCNTYKYSVGGKLLNISSRISKTESYVFDIRGKQIAHWIGEKCYDEHGNVIMVRKFVE